MDDPRWREELLCSRLGFIRKLAVYYDIPENERDDFVQETFIAAYNGIHDLKDLNKINGWLKKIAYRKSILFGRRRRSLADNEKLYSQCEAEQWEPYEVNNYKVWCILQQNRDSSAIFDMVKKLRPPAPEIIQMRFKEGFSLIEIAKILGMNYNTVKTIETRAFQKLKIMIEEEEDQ